MILGVGAFNASEKVRYFTDLTATSSQSWTLDSTVDLTGDFELHWESVDTLDPVSDGARIFGSSASSEDLVKLFDTGHIAVKINNFNRTIGTTGLDRTIFNKWSVTRTISPNVLEVFLNSVSQGTITTSTSSFTLDQLGSGAGLGFKEGILGNVKIYDAGTLIHSWSIDEANPAAIVDSVAGNNGTGANLSGTDAALYRNNHGKWTIV